MLQDFLMRVIAKQSESMRLCFYDIFNALTGLHLYFF
jgi:hypothetical protein